MQFFTNRDRIDEETLKPVVADGNGDVPEEHKNYDLCCGYWVSRTLATPPCFPGCVCWVGFGRLLQARRLRRAL